MNIELILSLTTIICLAWAAIEDIKNRLVPDKIWIIQILIAAIGLFFWFGDNIGFIERIVVISNIILGIVLGFAFVSFGAFGGGDGKALIATSISSPFLYTFAKVDQTLFMPPIFFLLTNMFFFFLLFAIMLLINNIYSINKMGPLFSETSGSLLTKFSILISGRRTKRENVEYLMHEDPAEILDGAWKLHTPLFSEPLTDEEYEKIEKETRNKVWNDIQAGKRTYLWTRPQPPGLVFFVLAYLSWIIFGSPLLPLFQ